MTGICGACLHLVFQWRNTMRKTRSWFVSLGDSPTREVSITEAYHMMMRHLRSKSRTRLILRTPH